MRTELNIAIRSRSPAGTRQRMHADFALLQDFATTLTETCYPATPCKPNITLPRVLLVDDCAVQRLMGTTLLLNWGVLPEVACDGLEAVLMVQEQEFDLILMDLEMPVLDGMAATARIRLHERSCRGRGRVPVVAYTASVSALNDGHWRDSGMDDALAKPTDVQGIGKCLERWCPTRQLLPA